MTWSFCYQLPNVGNSLKIRDQDNGLRLWSVALGRVWTPFGSRKNSKPRFAKCVKTAQNPQRQVHPINIAERSFFPKETDKLLTGKQSIL
jgi:hypothetical protein